MVGSDCHFDKEKYSYYIYNQEKDIKLVCTVHFLFTVTEGDGEFGKGTVFMYNTATNAVTGMHNSEELKYVQEAYKKSYGEDMRTETYTTKAPAIVDYLQVSTPTPKADTLNLTTSKHN